MVIDANIHIYADGASLEAVENLAGTVDGFTTNPSLVRAAGVTSYREFAMLALEKACKKPVSLEVFADDFPEIERQAREIASWGENAVVKIPITNSRGESTAPAIEKLSGDGIALNITAIMTGAQVCRALQALRGDDAILSIFAGRIADTGRDPEMIVRDAAIMAGKKARILWASTREPFNVFHALRAGADIITVPVPMLSKLSMFGRDLDEYSLETVRQFKKDAEGYVL